MFVTGCLRAAHRSLSEWVGLAGLPFVMVALIVTGGRLAAAETGSVPRQDLDFSRVIRPILSENCYKCHGPDDVARKSNLRFDVRAETLRPAKSGQIAIVPGAPEKSQMLSRITAGDPEKRMPPVSTGKKLSPAQIELLRTWISEGAAYSAHWAYVKPVRPSPPETQDQA